LPPEPFCPRNDDCQRSQAEALTRLADHADSLFDEKGAAMMALKDLGEIAGKWLRFCAFVRKWFPMVGWWLLPIVATLLSKGSSEALDALIQAATMALQGYAAGAGA
jgi:hypothetical protein